MPMRRQAPAPLQLPVSFPCPRRSCTHALRSVSQACIMLAVPAASRGNASSLATRSPTLDDRPCCSFSYCTLSQRRDVHRVALQPPRFCLPAAYREEDLMPSRGSAQFLLLFLRSRAKARVEIGSSRLRPDRRCPAPGRRRISASDPDRGRATAAPKRLAACTGRVAGAPPLPWASTASAPAQGADAWLERIGDQGDEPWLGDGKAGRG